MSEFDVRHPLSDEEAAMLAGQTPSVRALWMAAISAWAVAVQLHEAQHVITGAPVLVRVKPWDELSMRTKVLVYEAIRVNLFGPLGRLAVMASAMDPE